MSAFGTSRPFLACSRDLNLRPVLVLLRKPLSPGTIHCSRRQLLANAAIAASRRYTGRKETQHGR
jgi:hypothetical protein